jgi:hypothetical protein
MGSISEKHFDVEFIDRTRNILATYRGEHDVTLLMNCLLGLIIVAYERYEKSRHIFFDVPIKNIKELEEITLSKGFYFKPKKWKRKGSTALEEKTLRVLIKKFRNGIAHQNVEPKNLCGRWVGVHVWNEFDRVRDMEVELTVEQLKTFAILVSDIYLKNTHGINSMS